jgi:hypothetical protein
MRGDKGTHFFHSVELDKQCYGEPLALASDQFVIDATTRDDKRYECQNQMEAMTAIPKPQ